MARGKYAERGRSKQDADRRHAIAVAEANDLRRKVHELRHLRTENEALKQRTIHLQAQVDERSSDRVEDMQERLAFLEADREQLIFSWESTKDSALVGLMNLIDTIAPRGSRRWWELVADYGDAGLAFPKHLTSRALRIRYLKEEFGDVRDATFDPIRRSGRRVREQRAQSRARRRPRLDYTAPTADPRFIQAEAARRSKAGEGEQETESLT